MAVRGHQGGTTSNIPQLTFAVIPPDSEGCRHMDLRGEAEYVPFDLQRPAGKHDAITAVLTASELRVS